MNKKVNKIIILKNKIIVSKHIIINNNNKEINY
jgi:hypothetical protein